jgi:tRNA G18 (ribose-2'-O)-methylase SpoU
MAKVALGAEGMVVWKYFETTGGAIAHARSKPSGACIIGLEQDVRSHRMPVSSRDISAEVVLVLGEETTGLSEDIKVLCDEIWEIPQWGKKESLNVSNAGAIALYELRRAMVE